MQIYKGKLEGYIAVFWRIWKLSLWTGGRYSEVVAKTGCKLSVVTGWWRKNGREKRCSCLGFNWLADWTDWLAVCKLPVKLPGFMCSWLVSTGLDLTELIWIELIRVRLSMNLEHWQIFRSPRTAPKILVRFQTHIRIWYKILQPKPATMEK